MLVLPDLFAAAAETGAAARAALSAAARRAAEFTCRTVLLRPELRAGMNLRLDGFRPGLAAEWIVTAAEHRLDARDSTTHIRAAKTRD